MQTIDIISEATDVVDRCLTLVEIKAEVQEFLTRSSSKFICRCPNCRRWLERTQSWLHDIRSTPTPALAEGDLDDEELDAA
jgi:hypothetical protein